MSVRQSLLALLTLGPCYGAQLRAEYARRSGDARTLNVGQVSKTLARLERDGLVQTSPPDAQGLVYAALTSAGHDAVAAWFTSPSPELDLQELAVKFSLAASLPGIDAERAVATEQAAVPPAETSSTEEAPVLSAALATAARLEAAAARRRFLDTAAVLHAAYPDAAMPLAPSRPRRGRPVRREAGIPPAAQT